MGKCSDSAMRTAAWLRHSWTRFRSHGRPLGVIHLAASFVLGLGAAGRDEVFAAAREKAVGRNLLFALRGADGDRPVACAGRSNRLFFTAKLLVVETSVGQQESVDRLGHAARFRTRVRASSALARTQRGFGDGSLHRAGDCGLDRVSAPAAHPEETVKVDAAGGRSLRIEGVGDVDPGADTLGDACQQRKRDRGAPGGLRPGEFRDGASGQAAEQESVDRGDSGGGALRLDAATWRECSRDARREGRFDLLAKLGGVGQWGLCRQIPSCPQKEASAHKSPDGPGRSKFWTVRGKPVARGRICSHAKVDGKVSIDWL
jgi:hypothetical protein